MKKLTQKQIILKHLREDGGWMPAYELEHVNTKFGWLGHSAARRCRELVNEGKILREQRGKYAYYKAVGPVSYQIYTVQNEERTQIKIPIYD